MQFLRVYARQLYDENMYVKDVDPYEAGILKITDKGERRLSMHSTPGIIYYVLDEGKKLPVIR